jgi:competence protein ComFB
MEEKVRQIIDEICDEEANKTNPVYCVSPACRQDAACYVLNRIPPRYVSSGRGLAHVESAYKGNPQLQVDLVTLASEALKRVTTVQRSFYSGDQREAGPETGPCFNFPTITGRLFNGLTFEPISDVDVELRRNGELVEMVDSRWPNPYHIVQNTPGTYLFWPASEPAGRAGETAEFEFEICAIVEGYEPFHHFFRIELTAAGQRELVIRFSQDHALPDLYLLPE